MKLSLREFAEVVAELKVVSDNSSASESRQAARMVVCARIDLYLLAGSKAARSYTALTRDVSLTGTGVLSTVALPAGQELVVALPRQSAPLFVHAIVKHCRALADGIMSVGLEYTRIADATLCAALTKSGQERQNRIQQSVLA